MIVRTKKIEFVLFLLFMVLIKDGSADISADINFYNIDSNGNFIEKEIKNLSIIYYLNSDEKITKFSSNNDKAILNLNKEIFCWSGCNLVPQRHISQIDIEKDNELLSRHFLKIYKEDVNQKIGIILDKKIGLKGFKESGNKARTNIETDSLNNEDFVINYNGILKIEEGGEYSFFINITGGASISIDKKNIFNDLNEPKESSKKTFELDLTKGEHTFEIDYWTSNESSPNLLWKNQNQENFEIGSDKNLIFINGSINQKERYKTFKETLKLSSTPESYTLDYAVYPSYWLKNLSITDNRNPVLLVHGLHGEYPYWNDIPRQLNSSFDVWEFYYSPANSSNFLNAGLLKRGINDVLINYNLSKLDVISHSMGGLVTVGYIQNLGKSASKVQINYSDNIRKYVFIAAPSHGSYLSNRVIQNVTSIATCPVVERFTDPKDRSAQAYLDLAVGSEFSFLLDKNKLHNQIEYLGITGNKGIPCFPDESKENEPNEPDATNDGLVTIPSASLLNKEAPLVVLDGYDHANEIGQKYTCLDAFGCAGKCYWPFCFDAQHEVDIITAFLNDNNTSTIKSLLGENDTYIDPNNASSNPYTKGSVVLKILPADDINSVSLRNIDNGEAYNLTKWQDLIHNTQTNNWFYFSNDMNLSYSHEKYGLTFPAGTYKLYVNNIYKNKNIEIKAAQTTMEEINLKEDDDNDGTFNENDICPQETWSNLPQNTETKEYFIDPTGCHAFVNLQTTKWQTYNSNLQNIANQSGTGYFSTRNLTEITNSIEGFDYQPLLDDINNDGYNDIILFSGNYLKIFDHELNLIDEKFIGNLQGQPELYNIDSDSFMEIIFISNISSTDYFFVYEYNADFKQEFNFTIGNKGFGSGIKCTSLGNTKICIFMDNQQYVHIVNMSSKTGKSYNTSVYADTYEKIPAIGDLHNNGAKQAVFWFDSNNNNQYGLMVFDLINKSFDLSFNNDGIVDDIVESYSTRFDLKGPPILTDLNNDGKLEIAVSAFYDDKINFEYRNDWFTELFIYNSSGDKLFSKCEKKTNGNCNDDSGGINKWEGTNPFILNINNDSSTDICFIKDKKYSGMFKNMTINCYNYSGYLLLDSELSPRTDTVKTAAIADMNNDSNKEIITENKIYKQDGTSIYSHNFGSNFAIPVDIDKNGGLDLISTKNTQTKFFIDDYGTIKISNLSINPLNPSVDEDFNCSFILTGYDSMTANITWYKNNIKYRSETTVCNENEVGTSSKILAAQTSKDEEWKCSITAIVNRKKSLPKSKSVIIKDSAEFINNEIQSGRSYFYGTIKTKTNSTAGMNFKPLTADIDQDDSNELIIFSKNNLIIYGEDLELKNKKQVGALQGQPTIYNIDFDSLLEVIFISKIDDINYFFAYHYNGTFTQEFNLTINNNCSGSGIKCTLINNKEYCFFKDNKNIFYKINMANQQVTSLQTSNKLDTTATLPSISDFDNNGNLDGLWLYKNNTYGVITIDLANMDLSGFGKKELFKGIPSGNPVFVNIDNAGGDEIILSAGDISSNGFPDDTCKYAMLYVIDTDGTIIWSKKEQVSWCNDDIPAYTTVSAPIVLDYDNNNYLDICVIFKQHHGQSHYNEQNLICYDRYGNIILDVSNTETWFDSYNQNALLADMNHDDKNEFITDKYIRNFNGTILHDFSSLSGTQPPIPADLDKNGALDVIWTKQNQTKIFYGNCLNDKDNDNVCDSQDAIEGNSSQIDSNINSLNIVVDDTDNLNRKFTGKKRIEFKQGNNSIVSFNFNFSKRNLNLNGITIEKQNHTNFGSILIKGISLDSNETKTVYVDNLNESIETVCIKDTELNSIVEISRYCNGENEFLVKCNSTDQNGYNCTIMNNRLRIAGLKNSGVQQQQGDNTPPTITIMSPLNATYTGYFHINISLDEEGDNCYCNFNNTANSTLTKINSTFLSERVNSTEGYYRLNVHCNDTAGNPGNNSVYFGYENTTEQTSQSTTAGSGGGGSSSTCSEVWKCSDWSECNDGLQTRSCSPTNNCGTISPPTSKSCITPITPGITETKEPKPQTPPETNPSKPQEKPTQQPLSEITGAAIGAPKPNKGIGVFISIIIIYFGLYFYRKFF